MSFAVAARKAAKDSDSALEWIYGSFRPGLEPVQNALLRIRIVLTSVRTDARINARRMGDFPDLPEFAETRPT
jgi:hypothetical protein